VDDASFTTSNGKSFVFFFLIKKKGFVHPFKEKKKKSKLHGPRFFVLGHAR
jgi:hypothetical protein